MAGNADNSSASEILAERRLWERIREGDENAREEIVLRYLPFARSLARRYRANSDSPEDLDQVAGLGLLAAVKRYDPDRGIPFAGFASPTILGELRHHFRDKVWTVRVPRSLQERIVEVDRANEDLSSDLGRSPSVPEVAEQIGCSPAEVLEAMEAAHNRWHVSFERPVSTEDDDGGTLGEQLGNEDEHFELTDDRLSILKDLPNLDSRQREVLRLRFVEELPQTKIAEKVGCSQMQVSRILRQTLDDMRARIEDS